MPSDITRENDQVVVKPVGDVIASMAERFKKEMRETLHDGGSDIVIDMSEVTVIDSMGLSVLVATHNSLVKRDSRLQLTNVNDNILKLLKDMRLDHHFRIQAVG